jgi:hypothetical protein
MFVTEGEDLLEAGLAAGAEPVALLTLQGEGLGGEEATADALSRAVGAALGTGEGPVSTPECNSSQRALGGIVRETNPAIFQETGKTIPAFQHVIDRLDDLGRFAERGALPFQPLVHVIEQRLALFMPRGQSFFGAQSIDLAFDRERHEHPILREGCALARLAA